MTVIVLSALIISIIIYLYVGFANKKSIIDLGDIIPIIKGRIAKVKGHTELSASNVAASISLATVVVAFFDLVPSMGLWLLWPAITTAFGFWFFSVLSRKIWQRMSTYNHRPSLHEYIGTEFQSKNVSLIAAACTTVGYLCAFALELTVGSRFLAGLIPAIPEWITVSVLAGVGIFYTAMGGFRTVIITDVISMGFIYLLLAALLIFYTVYSFSIGGINIAIMIIPESLRTFTWNNTLIPFVSGILIMNLFTYISNMGLWQRIAGTQDPETIINGMKKTVFHSALSWILFALVAIGALIIVKPVSGENLLITLLNNMVDKPLGRIVLFCVTLGLYGAMLSTASTQLIAISHTFYEDILAPFRKLSLSERIISKKELRLSRIILIFGAVISVIMVEILRIFGFSVADMAFSIYGASLGLVPPILFSLFLSRESLKHLGIWANIAVITGFASAWGSAVYGKAVGNGNLIFWAPVFGLIISGIMLMTGWLFSKRSS